MYKEEPEFVTHWLRALPAKFQFAADCVIAIGIKYKS